MLLFSAQRVLSLPVPKNYFPVLQLQATPIGSCQESWWPWQLWQPSTQNCGANQWCQIYLYLCFTHQHHLLQKPTSMAQNALSPPLLLLYVKSLPAFHKKSKWYPHQSSCWRWWPLSPISPSHSLTLADSKGNSPYTLPCAYNDAFDYKKHFCQDYWKIEWMKQHWQSQTTVNTLPWLPKNRMDEVARQWHQCYLHQATHCCPTSSLLLTTANTLLQ